MIKINKASDLLAATFVKEFGDLHSYNLIGVPFTTFHHLSEEALLQNFQELIFARDF